MRVCYVEGRKDEGEKRMAEMEAGGGAPSPEQGQEVLPVLCEEIGHQVLVIHGGHGSSHQQSPEKPDSPSTAPLPAQPKSALQA